MAFINDLSDSEKRNIQRELELIDFELITFVLARKKCLQFHYLLEIPYEEDGATVSITKISKN